MTEISPASEIHRILVALDVSMQSAMMLEAAAMLAARTGAELVGLFVEDVNLIHLAGLPFARELDRTSGAERELDSERVSRALHRQAEQMRSALARVAETRNLRCSLQVVRGQYVNEALSAAAGLDVLFLSGTEWRAFEPPRARRATLLRPGVTGAGLSGRSRFRPVIALFDGSGGSARALATARDIAQHGERDLVVLLAGADAAATESLRAQALGLIGELRLAPRLRAVTAGDLSGLLYTVRQEGCSVLLMARDRAAADPAAFRTVLDRVGCPVALVP